MSASRKTVEDVKRIILDHISEDHAKAIIRDLLDVSGNQSFRETIQMLSEIFDVRLDDR